MEDPGAEILDTYDVLNKHDNIDLSMERLGVITHLLHQNPDIIKAGIFGSRSDTQKEVNDCSDIDIAVILDSYTEDKIAQVDFSINRRYRSITGENTEIHICCLNEEVDHGQNAEMLDRDFRETVKDQIIALKGDIG